MLCSVTEPHLISHYTILWQLSLHPIRRVNKVFLILVWYTSLSMFYFNKYMWWGNHNSLFPGYKSSNIWINTVTFGWGYSLTLHTHCSSFQRALPSLLHSPLLCYSFLLLLVSAHDKKECLPWTNSSSHDTSRVSFPLTDVNLKGKRRFQCGLRDMNNISHHYPEATRVCSSCSLIRLLMTMPRGSPPSL